MGDGMDKDINLEGKWKSLALKKEDWKRPKSKSELLYDWRFKANQFVLAPSPSRLTTRDFFQLNHILSDQRMEEALRIGPYMCGDARTVQ
jgi:hypothetical protein